jgi:hypothetical protein
MEYVRRAARAARHLRSTRDPRGIQLGPHLLPGRKHVSSSVFMHCDRNYAQLLQLFARNLCTECIREKYIQIFTGTEFLGNFLASLIPNNPNKVAAKLYSLHADFKAYDLT